MCACVFTEGEAKGMYRHDGSGGGEGEGEVQRLTAISPNHLDVRDTVSAESGSTIKQKHTRTHMCLPPGSLW